MWIKTKDGTYVNSDHITYVCYDYEENTTDCEITTGTIFEICDGNHIRDIITNIISGTKIMEVR